MPQLPEHLLRRLNLPVVRRLEGLLQGDYTSPSRGDGLDLADLRAYQLHDDVRRMDWNATARLNEPYVRDYLEDREIPVWLLLDMSPSMRFEGVSISKHAVLMEWAVLICRLMLGRGNRAGAMIFSHGVDQIIPAKGGRRQLLDILHAIQTHHPRPGTTDLGKVLMHAPYVIGRKSLIFIVSDFISPSNWDSALRHLSARHDVVGVWLTDPLEARLPDLGLVTFQDAESGEQLFVDTHDQNFRTRFALAAQAHQNRLRSTFETAGVDVVELSTEDDVLDAMIGFAAMRKQTLRRTV